MMASLSFYFFTNERYESFKRNPEKYSSTTKGDNLIKSIATNHKFCYHRKPFQQEASWEFSLFNSLLREDTYGMRYLAGLWSLVFMVNGELELVLSYEDALAAIDSNMGYHTYNCHYHNNPTPGTPLSQGEFMLVKVSDDGRRMTILNGQQTLSSVFNQLMTIDDETTRFAT
ncbi:MAG: hypothetical protein OXC40_04355, partial [Proteobacteria bacterium]|nr:hypothetical protein [Pseudomonadota bacterium]